MCNARLFQSLLLTVTLLALDSSAQTVITVPLAQGTQQMCTIPPPSSVSLDTCINQLNGSGYTLQCCNSVQQATGNQASQILGLLGLTVNPSTALVGLQCQRISGYTYYYSINCNTQLLCCQNDDYSGVITIGCFPVTQY